MNKYKYGINNVGWSIGALCNANCVQCYSREARQNGDLLSQNDILIVLNKLETLGVRTINLGGNEPIFTHSLDDKDSVLPFLIREAKKRGMIIGITTNGTTAVLLNRDFADEFDMVDDWDISLDSPFKDEHDNNRGCGFYDIAMEALDLMRTRGCNASIIYCLMRFNCTIKHARALSEITKKYKVDLRINTLKPTREELMKLEANSKMINDFFIALSQYYIVVHNSDISTAVTTEDNINNCPCGKYSFAISPKRKSEIHITPCVYLQDFGVGNILKDDIDLLLESDIFNTFRDNVPHDCEYCKDIKNCNGGCLAYKILMSKDEICDPRCHIKEQKKPIFIKDCQFKDLAHVHENYLCTWIGRNK